MCHKQCQLMSCLILSTMMPSVASFSLFTCTTLPPTLSLALLSSLIMNSGFSHFMDVKNYTCSQRWCFVTTGKWRLLLSETVAALHFHSKVSPCCPVWQDNYMWSYCLGRCQRHQSCRCSKDMWPWHFGTPFRGHDGVRVMVELHDLGDVFQQFYDSLYLRPKQSVAAISFRRTLAA